MRRVLAIFTAMMTSGCSLPTHGAHTAGGSAQEPFFSSSNTPEIRDERAIMAYALGCIEQISPVIEYRYTGSGNAFEHALSVADQLMREGSVVFFSISTRNNDVKLTPIYADSILMLKAHENPQMRSMLNDNQRRALAIAENLVRSVCARYSSDYDRALALHDYLVETCQYKIELHGRDTANATAHLLLTRKGVCDSYTRTYGLLLSMAGIQNIFVAGTSDDGGNHCWNLVLLNNRWVHVDCTYSDPTPDDPGRVLHSHFALPDNLIERDRSWNRSLYPAAVSPELYYPYRYASFRTVYDLLVWSRHKKDGTYVTAYVEELNSIGTDAERVNQLLSNAYRRLGVPVIKTYALDEHLPGIIIFKCGTP